MPKARRRWTKRKLLSFQFKDRPRRALLWRKATYELWYKFAKIHQANGGSIPKEFGDLKQFEEFEDWWRHPKYGFELFCEPEYEKLVQPSSGKKNKDPNVVRFDVRINADRELILRDFELALKKVNEHHEYQSQARFQPSLPQQQLKLQKLEQALEGYLLSETMVHRRAIRRLFTMQEGEIPHFKRVLTHKPKPNNRDDLIPARVLIRDEAKCMGYDRWVIKKMRLLSRQRKLVREAFDHIESGTFP